MPSSERTQRLAVALAGALAVAVIAVALVLALTGDGDEEPTDTARGAPTEPSAERTPEEERSRNGGGAAPGDEPAAPASVEERRARRVVHDYVTALTDRDGERVCDLFVPGALDRLDFPEQRGSCGESLSASIGYRDPRGFPQWERATVEHFASTEVGGDEARVTATIVSDFADREQPSVEDDVIYLERSADRWLIVQPSAVLYRAIGVPDVPPQVLSPPG